MPRSLMSPGTRRRGFLPVMLAALALMIGLASCTGDDANPMGAGLGNAAIDTLLRELVVRDLVHHGQLEVVDPANPLDQAGVLYLGGRDGDASSIVVNFDFANLAHPDSAALDTLLTDDNVTSVKLKLLQLLWYLPGHGGLVDDDDEDLRPWAGAAKVFDVHQLSAPFDSLSFPDQEPAYDPNLLSLSSEPAATSSLIFIDLDKAAVLQWVRERARVGILIREGSGSTPGLVGFSSKEMQFGGSTLDTDNALTALGPSLQFGLRQQPDDWEDGRQDYIQQPTADASTWHALQETSLDPSDRIEVRAHLRSYPVLRFDPGVLPERIRINLAQVVLHVDTSLTHGPPNILTVSEYALADAPDGTRTRVILDDVDAATDLIGGGRLQPENTAASVVRLNVTSALQRYVNGLQDADAGFLIAHGERFFSGFVSSPGPDFYFARWVFHGTGAGPELGPRLEILYTRIDELTDGGD